MSSIATTIVENFLTGAKEVAPSKRGRSWQYFTYRKDGQDIQALCSYGDHFPLILKYADGSLWRNVSKASPTTGGQQNSIIKDFRLNGLRDIPGKTAKFYVGRHGRGGDAEGYVTMQAVN